MLELARQTVVRVAGIAACAGVALLGGCGGGGSSTTSAALGAADGGAPQSTIDGNISQPTPDARPAIPVTVSGGGFQSTVRTDAFGGFLFYVAPVGDVIARFGEGSCSAEIPFADVTNGSRLTIRYVRFDCGSATPSRVDEVFRGVLRSTLPNRVAQLEVCVAAGASHVVRSVKTDTETLFADETGQAIDFTQLAPGDFVETTGYREHLGAPSSVVAGRVQQLARGRQDACATQ